MQGSLESHDLAIAVPINACGSRCIPMASGYSGWRPTSEHRGRGTRASRPWQPHHSIDHLGLQREHRTVVFYLFIYFDFRQTFNFECHPNNHVATTPIHCGKSSVFRCVPVKIRLRVYAVGVSTSGPRNLFCLVSSAFEIPCLHLEKISAASDAVSTHWSRSDGIGHKGLQHRHDSQSGERKGTVLFISCKGSMGCITAAGDAGTSERQVREADKDNLACGSIVSDPGN